MGKSKIEKDKGKIELEANDARAATEEVARAKGASEKSNKVLAASLNELGKKVEEANMTLGDFESCKRRLAAENADLLRVVGDLTNNVNMIAKMKQSLVSALDEETASCDDIARQTKKAEGEAATWRSKYESDAVAKAEELEMTKMKLTARLTEAETTISNLGSKLNQIDKAKAKLQSEIEEMTVNLDQAQILNNLMEKKAKQFDKIVGEWKRKADGLAMDLDVTQKECRNASSELFRIKAAYEESLSQLDEVRRENKTLSNEIKDIMDQISEGGRSIHEIDKIRKRLSAEKLELQAALEEAEG